MVGLVVRLDASVPDVEVGFPLILLRRVRPVRVAPELEPAFDSEVDSEGSCSELRLRWGGL